MVFFKQTKWRVLIVLFVAVVCLQQNTVAQYVKEYQYNDTIYHTRQLPHKATFFSALVPGLGQIYNKKYWKLPIIYAGFTALAYYAGYNNFVYKQYKEGYNIKLLIENGDTTLTDNFKYASTENLMDQRDTWRKNRDLCIIGMGLLYIAQIIDANVDAHLFDYDISPNLSMRVEPVYIDPRMFAYQNAKARFGVRCCIRF